MSWVVPFSPVRHYIYSFARDPAVRGAHSAFAMTASHEASHIKRGVPVVGALSVGFVNFIKDVMPRRGGPSCYSKVSDFGSNLLKCYSSRWAPNLLKSATWPLAPSNVLKCVPGGGDPVHKKGLHFTQKGLRSTGGPDLR